MSIDPMSTPQQVRALKESETGGSGEFRAQVAPAGADPKLQAFKTQIEMAQSLFADPDDGGRMCSSGTDASVMTDSLMLDALRTIARLSSEALERDPALRGRSVRSRPLNSGAAGVGGLSARFESGPSGVEAIGYDRVGGTSYGKYQLASRTGSLDRFLDYLGRHEPAWADRLRKSGPGNTGSAEGRMPDEWRRIARENPARFERMQHDFILRDHYLPARDKILEATGVDVDKAPKALREVLWSTSVQHGPSGAARIFSRVISEALGREQGDGLHRKVIDGVYADRQNQFGSSTAAVRRSVQNRLREERVLALGMLDKAQVSKVV